MFLAQDAYTPISQTVIELIEMTHDMILYQWNGIRRCVPTRLMIYYTSNTIGMFQEASKCSTQATQPISFIGCVYETHSMAHIRSDIR